MDLDSPYAVHYIIALLTWISSPTGLESIDSGKNICAFWQITFPSFPRNCPICESPCRLLIGKMAN